MMHPYTPGTPVRPGYTVISIPATSWKGDEIITVQIPDPHAPPAAPAPAPCPRRPAAPACAVPA
ncbi:hypothetical protein [Deinococcus arenicola]|uniref:Uncharacterized protein n=1 Tax=Deinococcus arenicola TaxID=2994950 RepID=A0ABU4DXE5_9DEIO|nr:hypothetical protein [Deinococcus sp. ZS9-10]MDV6376354.1 hypothetical protein [Deinococcus sp. ZS9-10]